MAMASLSLCGIPHFFQRRSQVELGANREQGVFGIDSLDGGDAAGADKLHDNKGTSNYTTTKNWDSRNQSERVRKLMTRRFRPSNR
jgi:hypothetical protein